MLTSTLTSRINHFSFASVPINFVEQEIVQLYNMDIPLTRYGQKANEKLNERQTPIL